MAEILTLYIKSNGTCDIEMTGETHAHCAIVASKGLPPHRPSFVNDDEWQLICDELVHWGGPHRQVKVIWQRNG